MKKILQENPNISLIHLNDGLMAAFAYFLKKTTDIPVVVTFHGLDLVFPSFLYQKLAVKYFKKLDGVVTVSKATAEECLNRGFDPKKIFVVKNGVDTDISKIKKDSSFRNVMEEKLQMSLKDKKVIVSIGRCVRRKGFSWFLKNVMTKLDKNVLYVIIGPPQNHIKQINFLLKLLPKRLSRMISVGLGFAMDEIEIQEALKNPELQNRAFYLGKLPFEQMIQFLKNSDLYVMPNIKVNGDAEGFGLVALEAAICGMPVVASKLEGITCAISNNNNGFLIEPENSNLWSKQISSLLNDMDDLVNFGENAKKYTLNNYSWERMCNGYIQVFNKFQNQPQQIESNNDSANVLVASNREYSKVAV